MKKGLSIENAIRLLITKLHYFPLPHSVFFLLLNAKILLFLFFLEVILLNFSFFEK